MLCINIGLWVAVTFMFTDGHVGKIEDLAPSRPLTKNPGLLTGFPPKKSERTSNTTIHSSLDVMQLMCHELKDLIWFFRKTHLGIFRYDSALISWTFRSEGLLVETFKKICAFLFRVTTLRNFPQIVRCCSGAWYSFGGGGIADKVIAWCKSSLGKQKKRGGLDH